MVQQIDYLTSSIDLNEEEQQRTAGGDSNSSSASSSSEERRGHHNGSRSPPNVLLSPVTSCFSSERSRTLRFTSSLGSSPRQGGPQQSTDGTPKRQNLPSYDLTLSPQRSLPVRPPTPGLSPLTVNLHHTNSPGSQPHSPGPSSSIRVSPPSPLSPKPQQTPILSPPVIVENKIGSYQTPQSADPSAGQLSPSSTQPPSASCPPTASDTVSNNDRERRASSAGPVNGPSQVFAAPAATAKPPTAPGRRGRKPPPYPHHRPSEQTKKVKEPRKAPPYPEKRRLLSTTV